MASTFNVKEKIVCNCLILLKWSALGTDGKEIIISIIIFTAI